MIHSFAVTSASKEHGDQFSVCVDGEMIEIEEGEIGIGIVVVDPRTRKVSYKHLFDTHHEESESENLIKTINRIKDGAYYVIGVKGEGAKRLTNQAKDSISKLGSHEINKLECGESWAMIGKKGDTHTIREARQVESVTILRSDHF